MTKHNPGSRDPFSRPDLKGVPLAVRKLARRYGITISHAMIVARNAGIGGPEVF